MEALSQYWWQRRLSKERATSRGMIAYQCWVAGKSRKLIDLLWGHDSKFTNVGWILPMLGPSHDPNISAGADIFNSVTEGIYLRGQPKEDIALLEVSLKTHSCQSCTAMHVTLCHAYNILAQNWRGLIIIWAPLILLYKVTQKSKSYPWQKILCDKLGLY